MNPKLLVGTALATFVTVALFIFLKKAAFEIIIPLVVISIVGYLAYALGLALFVKPEEEEKKCCSSDKKCKD